MERVKGIGPHYQLGRLGQRSGFVRSTYCHLLRDHEWMVRVGEEEGA